MRLRPLVLITLACVISAMLPAAADAGRSQLRTCRAPAADHGVTRLRSDGVRCKRARAIARRVSRIRRTPAAYDRARRCRGEYCLRVAGLRCRPTRTAESRERCKQGGRVVTWLWRWKR